MNPENTSILDFTYELPEEKIAKYPLADRDASRLLIYRQGAITQDIYKNIASYLPENALLVFNNTRVIEARILFQKPTAGFIEIFCLEPGEGDGDIHHALQQQHRVCWKCLIGGATKWKRGQILQKKVPGPDKDVCIQAVFLQKKEDHFLIELRWKPPALTFAEVLHACGTIPLPPYLKRLADQTDVERYQTVYASQEGSVAAPTAGLHFTRAIFDTLTQKHIRKAEITLHVGAGTFLPVKSPTLAEHPMHAEFLEIHLSTIEMLASCLDQPIVAVGTTSLRALESLYWLGARIMADPSIAPDGLFVSQWEPYEMPDDHLDAISSLKSLAGWMKTNRLEKLIAKTRLLIVPGYCFRISDALITNFHQPQSTLLLLVAALIGDDWKKVYDYALSRDYRFLSYGDGCLLFSRKD